GITGLAGLEPVRLRPGMYIGSTGARGLHQLAFELVDNAVDEALAGRADTISFTIHPDGSVTVSDNGSGIPVDTMDDQGQSALTVVLTKLHAGGKFGGDGTPYKVSGGLHGVGVSVVNALSEWLTVEGHRDGNVYKQSFARGEPTGELEVAGKATDTGTTITFLPDVEEIFEDGDWSYETLSQRLRETAFLTRGLRIVLTDERAGGEQIEFHYEGGIRDFVQHVNAPKDPIHKRIAYFESENEQGAVEVAMQWNSSYQESLYTFANNINTHEGGSHLSGFNAALTRTINKFARDLGLLKEKEDNLEGDSAGGAAKEARDKSNQAILPLRGKIINSEKNRIDKVLSNAEIQLLVQVIGTGIGEEFDISKLRYHRVIVMTDADVDGAHI